MSALPLSIDAGNGRHKGFPTPIRQRGINNCQSLTEWEEGRESGMIDRHAIVISYNQAFSFQDVGNIALPLTTGSERFLKNQTETFSPLVAIHTFHHISIVGAWCMNCVSSKSQTRSPVQHYCASIHNPRR